MKAIRGDVLIPLILGACLGVAASQVLGSFGRSQHPATRYPMTLVVDFDPDQHDRVRSLCETTEQGWKVSVWYKEQSDIDRAISKFVGHFMSAPVTKDDEERLDQWGLR